MITAFGFFPFWILAAMIDGYVLLALTGQLSPFATAFWANFPQFFYVTLYGLDGVWIGIGSAGAGGFKWWQAALIALLSFAWLMLLMSSLLR